VRSPSAVTKTVMPVQAAILAAGRRVPPTVGAHQRVRADLAFGLALARTRSWVAGGGATGQSRAGAAAARYGVRAAAARASSVAPSARAVVVPHDARARGPGARKLGVAGCWPDPACSGVLPEHGAIRDFARCAAESTRESGARAAVRPRAPGTLAPERAGRPSCRTTTRFSNPPVLQILETLPGAAPAARRTVAVARRRCLRHPRAAGGSARNGAGRRRAPRDLSARRRRRRARTGHHLLRHLIRVRRPPGRR